MGMTISASVPCTLLMLAAFCLLLEEAAKDSTRLWALVRSHPRVATPRPAGGYTQTRLPWYLESARGLVGGAGLAWLGWLVGMMFRGPLGGILFAIACLGASQIQRLAHAARRRRAVAVGLRWLIRDLQLVASSGETALKCIGKAAERAPEPVRALLTSAVLAVQMGKPLYQALARVQELAAFESYRDLLQIAWLHTQTGASLASMLSESVRRADEAAIMQGELEAKLGEARWTARVLATVPMGVLAYMMLYSPSSFQPMLDDPSGVSALLVGGGLWVAGLLLVARMQVAPASLGVEG